MVPRHPEPPSEEVNHYRILNEDVSSIRLRPHLEGFLGALDEDGNLKNPTPQTSQASCIPSTSISSSQISASDGGHSSGIDLHREQPGTPMTAHDHLDDTTSTVNATHGTARTIRDFEETPFIWGQQNHDNSNQTNEAHDRRNKEHVEEHAAVTNEIQSSAYTTQTRFILIILTLITFSNFALAIHTIHQTRHKTTTLKETKLTLLLTTHVVAICAALGAVVMRRTPTEALLYFVVIVLLGNMVRREVECFL